MVEEDAAADTGSEIDVVLKHCCLSDLEVVVKIFFFFQAEDGIRDYKVTGVQTCALPISGSSGIRSAWCPGTPRRCAPCGGSGSTRRSEERREGKECRSRWSPYH